MSGWEQRVAGIKNEIRYEDAFDAPVPDGFYPSRPPCDMTADCPAPKHSKGCWRGYWVGRS